MKPNSSLRYFFAVMAMSALVVAAYSQQPEAPKAVAPVSGALPVVAPAPVWTLKDVHGKSVNSAQFKGKVVVVDFWATWCGPCRSEIPGYIELQNKYGKDGFVVVGISLDQAGPKVVEDFVKKFGMNYQVVMGDDSIQEAFGGMDAIPTTFLIDRDGRIRDRKVGAESKDEYEKKVASLLK